VESDDRHGGGGGGKQENTKRPQVGLRSRFIGCPFINAPVYFSHIVGELRDMSLITGRDSEFADRF
jgi:hypothetical protein